MRQADEVGEGEGGGAEAMSRAPTPAAHPPPSRATRSPGPAGMPGMKPSLVQQSPGPLPLHNPSGAYYHSSSPSLSGRPKPSLKPIFPSAPSSPKPSLCISALEPLIP